MTELKKGARITGADRTKLAGELKKAYDKGTSIRELADKHGRSYGFVHRVLSESGVQLRGRGGATRTKADGGKATVKSTAGAAKSGTAKASTAKASTAKASTVKTAKASATKAAPAKSAAKAKSGR